MTPEEFQSIKEYVGFDEAQERLLSELHAVAEPRFGIIVDDFYGAIQAHASARAAITGGAEQIARLKGTLQSWLARVLQGPHDDQYLALHSNIGRVHVRIRLPQHFMFSAVNRIRVQLLKVIADDVQPASKRGDMADAVHRILDLELAIMLDSYRKDLVERMRTQERLATIGEMAATVAHELRNPLGTIQSSLYLAEQRLAVNGFRDEVLQKHCRRIGQQVELCGATIANLLELAQNRPPQIRSFRFEPLLRGAVEAANLPERISVEQSIDGAESSPTGDPDQLRQVLLNLLVNAGEAIPATGKIVLRAGPAKPGHYFSVQDDGPGIRPEHRERIFDPLFTTKATGTGLGLGLCRKVIDAHKGSLELVPSSRGAHFRVWLPDVEASESAS